MNIFRKAIELHVCDHGYIDYVHVVITACGPLGFNKYADEGGVFFSDAYIGALK